MTLDQNPHKPTRSTEKILEVAIGVELKALRKKKGLTVAELSTQSNLSLGMLSKIENGLTSPSLTTLQGLADVLSVPITAFFRRFEEKREAVKVAKGEGVEIERAGTRAGHQYSLLGHLGSNTSGVISEPYLITLTSESDVFEAFQHDGIEFLYMLEGQVEYRHNNTLFELKPGDSLFFEADAPHGPGKLVSLPARYLSIICYPQKLS